jgi:hypothetical protein
MDSYDTLIHHQVINNNTRLIQHQQQQYHSTSAGASSTSAVSQHECWSIINISTRLEIFSMKLAFQQHQHKAGNLQHEASINSISTKLEIFSTRLTSTTSTRSWKSSALGWHQQHQHEAGNLQH